mmetsp:Transcript_12384/g.34472  ORF Transcript_12384/g.34472 Transcript_12384/m.34472 type:complete len:211 (-) Transcript_12384:108-740(-)
MVKVKVFYYEETLCPDCAKFGAGSMNEAVENLSDYMDLYVVAYGNERYNESTGTYTCQHGEEECYMNLIEACLDLYAGDDYRRYYPFFKCADDIVANVYPHIKGISAYIMKKCASTLPSDITPEILDSCATGNLGQELIAISRHNTESLNPPHTYVPWVVVDKKPVFQNYDNISAIVCEEWARLNDANPPPECSKLASTPRQRVSGVCTL